MTTNEAIEIFLEARVGIRQPKTIRWYRGNLRLFKDFAGETDIESIAIYTLRSWRAYLVKRGLSPWSIHGYLRAVKFFFKWLQQEGILQENPAQRLELPRLPKKPKTGIQDKDRDAMIVAVQDRPRDFAMLLFAATTGCRVDGLATLSLKNLDLEKMQAMVTEKGMKSRFVYFDEKTKHALSNWLEMRHAREATERVFLTMHGTPISTAGIYQVFKRTAKNAGVEKSWSPHQWRHAFARNFLRNGGDIGILSQLLGHSSISVTLNHYGGLANDDLKRAHNKYVPKLNFD